MESDALRPTPETCRSIFGRGFRLWHNLHLMAMDDDAPPSLSTQNIEALIRNHPYFPKDLDLKEEYGVLVAQGSSMWNTSGGSCSLPSFKKELDFTICSRRPKNIHLTPLSPYPFEAREGPDSGSHLTVLFLAWAYILSTRWSELMPGARISFTERTGDHPAVEYIHDTPENKNSGEVDNGALRWWAALLDPGGGWEATIDVGKTRNFSPWSVSIQTSAKAPPATMSPPPVRSSPAPSYNISLQYVMDYCAAHQVSYLCDIALSAALHLPCCGKDVKLPVPAVRYFAPLKTTTPILEGPRTHWTQEDCNIDKLLALGCNIRGLKALLLSVLYEPGIPCNSASPWIQSAFSVLGSIQSEAVLLKILSARAPKLEFLWAGALVLGTHKGLFSNARAGLIPVELHSAAWTGSVQSFIQEPVTSYTESGSDGSTHIQHADECRLLYLCQTEQHSRVPTCQWTPFGTSPVEDTDIEVRLHYRCGHALVYGGWAWKCNSGDVIQPGAAGFGCQTWLYPTESDRMGMHDVEVDYDKLDIGNEVVSQNATRSIFSWLRSEGYLASEKGISLHEWLEPYDSDDDTDLGDLESTGNDQGSRVAEWLAMPSE